MFIAVVQKRMNWDQDHLDADESLPKIYWNPNNLEQTNTTTNRAKAHAPTFDQDWLEPLRFKRIQEGEMNAVISELVVYMIYLFIVLKISYGNRDINAYPMKTNLLNTVVHGGVSIGDYPTFTHPQSGKHVENRWKDFSKVRTSNHWWLWLHTTLLPSVRVQNWYNDDPPYGLRGYMDDRVNRIIGYAIVRQVREKAGTCRTHVMMRDFVDSCTGDLQLSIFDEDYRTFCMGWAPLIHPNCSRMAEYNYR